jgi:ABC-type branched-subunit amino acid transport system substrate-binding protein
LDFEALFIPDSVLRVKMITSQLAFYDVKGLKLLGPSLWHSPDLMKKGVEYLEGASFVDSFLVNGFLPQTNDFVDIYYSAYGREPGNIEALSYDTMGMVLSVLEDQQIKTRAEFIRALMALEGFRGATGSISFGGNRVAQKDAFILRVQNGKIEQVK